MANEVSYIEYKGRAFVREHDTICYGNMTDPYVLYMMIMSYKKSPKGDEEVPGTIMVQLLDSQTKKPEKQKITNGLAEAFEFAEAWLRYNDKD